jgi:hypothetical protein
MGEPPQPRDLRASGRSRDELERMGYKELGRQAVLIGEAGLKAAGAQLAATEETNRLLRELLSRLPKEDANGESVP